MKLVVLSDIHANIWALQAVLDELKREGEFLLILAGDLVNMGPRPQETLQLLAKYDGQSLVISGNHEGYVLAQRGPSSLPPPYRTLFAPSRWTMKQLASEELDYLENLPRSVSLTDPEGGRVEIYHGSPRSQIDCVFPNTSREELERMMEPHLFEGTLVICGHTHVPSVHRLPGGTVLNAGSVGMSYGDDPRACYAIVEWDYEQRRWEISHRRVSYDQTSLLAELEQLAHPKGAGPVAKLIARGMSSANPYFLDGFLRSYTTKEDYPSPPEDYGHLEEAIELFLLESEEKMRSAG